MYLRHFSFTRVDTQRFLIILFLSPSQVQVIYLVSKIFCCVANTQCTKVLIIAIPKLVKPATYTSLKVLGLIIQSDLKGSEHITSVVAKASKHLHTCILRLLLLFFLILLPYRTQNK